jgi:hypothetical protein
MSSVPLYWCLWTNLSWWSINTAFSCEKLGMHHRVQWQSMTLCFILSMPKVSPISPNSKQCISLVTLCNTTGVCKLNNDKVVNCITGDSYLYACKWKQRNKEFVKKTKMCKISQTEDCKSHYNTKLPKQLKKEASVHVCQLLVFWSNIVQQCQSWQTFAHT